jgi:DNA-directed RNA polymerase specialized sigma24 family protein
MLLEMLSARHNEWLKMVKSFGADYDTANDVVQDMYLKMHKFVESPERIMFENGEVNTYYVFVTLRNLYIDTTKAVTHENLQDVSIDTETNLSALEALETLMEALETEMETWRWYDREMFKVYHFKNLNIREISEGTKITERSIWNTLNNGKKRIQTNCLKEYEAYRKAKKG